MPPSSQWAAMNYGVEYLVVASQIGPYQAIRVPIEQRMRNIAMLAPALLADAIARWS